MPWGTGLLIRSQRTGSTAEAGHVKSYLQTRLYPRNSLSLPQMILSTIVRNGLSVFKRNASRFPFFKQGFAGLTRGHSVPSSQQRM